MNWPRAKTLNGEMAGLKGASSHASGLEPANSLSKGAPTQDKRAQQHSASGPGSIMQQVMLDLCVEPACGLENAEVSGGKVQKQAAARQKAVNRRKRHAAINKVACQKSAAAKTSANKRIAEQSVPPKPSRTIASKQTVSTPLSPEQPAPAISHGASSPRGVSLRGILEPLRLLDKRLLEARAVAEVFRGTPFENYRVSSLGPVATPAAGMIPGTALWQLKEAFGLSDFEVGVVVMAIAPELDRRYERLYASLQAGAHRKPRVELALRLLCDCPGGVERQSFAAGASLSWLLEPLGHTPGHAILLADEAGPLDVPLQLNSMVSRYLLGQRSLDSLLSTCAQVDWSQEKAAGEGLRVPLLDEISQRLRSRKIPLPLSLIFTGEGLSQEDRAKEATAFAAALNRPLLRVNLSKLLNIQVPERRLSFSQAGSSQALERRVCQLLLQAQLWNAVLYIESACFPTAPSRFSNQSSSQRERSTGWASCGWQPMSADLKQALYRQLCCYPGVTIFNEEGIQSLLAKTVSHMVTVPLTASFPQLTDNPSQSASCSSHFESTEANSVQLSRKASEGNGWMQLASQEIERFRLRLMRLSIEF